MRLEKSKQLVIRNGERVYSLRIGTRRRLGQGLSQTLGL
jgi:hypothetical protein